MTADRSLVEFGPAHGDVVVERDRHSTNTFRLRISPDNTAPLALTAREPAIRLGRKMAEASAVDLWFCEEATCQLLARHRRDGSIPLPEPEGQDSPLL